TNLDRDKRGRAKLYIKAVTDKQIKYVTTGEKHDEIETFHREQMATRILGMGDVLTLIKKAQTNVDEKQANQLEEKMRTMSFTFDDFLEQMGKVRKMGPLDELLAMMTGAGKMKVLNNVKIDEKQLCHI